MKRDIHDVDRRLEFAQSHEMARKALAWPLFGVAIGLMILVSLNGKPLSSRDTWTAYLVISVSLAFLGAVIYRLLRPSEPDIVLTRDGVLFTPFSEKVIPWNEIRAVGVAKVSATRDLMSTRVTKLVVSRSFFQRAARPGDLSFGDSCIAVLGAGDSGEVYLSYYHPPPFDELQAAIRMRWQAFSRHAPQTGMPTEVSAMSPAPEALGVSAGLSRGVVQRASSSAVPGLLGAHVRQLSPGTALACTLALAAIAALGTNKMGMWSTAGQLKGRAESEEWRRLREKWAAEEKASAAERKRAQERMDRAFRCMDLDWDYARRGIRNRDPDCMRDGK